MMPGITTINPETNPTENLIESLASNQIEAESVELDGYGPLNSAIILKHIEDLGEESVRVYRGVNNLDASALNQLPYALRVNSQESEHFDAHKEVSTLAYEPSYLNLLAYTGKVAPHLTTEQQRMLDFHLNALEEGVLRGWSVRTELMYNQFGHNGGVYDLGFSPYISASWDPEESFGYSGLKGGLLVIDLPIRRIQDLAVDSTEVSIIEQIAAKDIAAIIPRNKLDFSDPNARNYINGAINEVSNRIRKVSSLEHQTLLRRRKLTKDAEWDRKQHPIDVQEIRSRKPNLSVSKITLT